MQIGDTALAEVSVEVVEYRTGRRSPRASEQNPRPRTKKEPRQPNCRGSFADSAIRFQATVDWAVSSSLLSLGRLAADMLAGLCENTLHPGHGCVAPFVDGLGKLVEVQEIYRESHVGSRISLTH